MFYKIDSEIPVPMHGPTYTAKWNNYSPAIL